MNHELLIKLIGILVWPILVVFLVIFLRNAITGVISRIKGIEGPNGIKILCEVQKVQGQLKNIEELTADIYHISGRSEAVRDEIFYYVADILNNKVSKQTALEMKVELNKYHLNKHICKEGYEFNDIKQMLAKLNLLDPNENEINEKFIDALLKFQKSKMMKDADGIIGPKTLKLLVSETQ